MAAGNWITCTSTSHEGRMVHVNLDRVDLIYDGEKGGAVVVMAGWPDGEMLHVEESAAVLLGLPTSKSAGGR